MKKLLAISSLLFAIALPALAQQWHLSPDDQSRFDSYFSRWQDYRQRNDRDQTVSMERRMLDIYSRYNVPSDTPFWRVASNARRGRRFSLSSNDQARFDSYFSRWQDYRQRNDGDQTRSMEGRMQDIYRHYNIPSGTPYFMVASNARDEDWDRWDRERLYQGEGGGDHDRDADRDHDQDREHGRDHDRGRDNWRGRLSNEDQARFDSYYSRWQSYRRDNNRSQVQSMEGRMYGIYQTYQIPREVPFDQVASH